MNKNPALDALIDFAAPTNLDDLAIILTADPDDPYPDSAIIPLLGAFFNTADDPDNLDDTALHELIKRTHPDLARRFAEFAELCDEHSCDPENCEDEH